jgi:hypothetical protein
LPQSTSGSADVTSLQTADSTPDNSIKQAQALGQTGRQNKAETAVNGRQPTSRIVKIGRKTAGRTAPRNPAKQSAGVDPACESSQPNAKRRGCWTGRGDPTHPQAK